jgi:hypothetical protein
MTGRTIREIVAMGLVLGFATNALADRLPSTRMNGQRSSGALIDMTVPYLNHPTTAFRGYSVAPQVKSSPIVSDMVNPGAKPVYNLPFYGGKQAFGSGSNGAVQVPVLPVGR